MTAVDRAGTRPNSKRAVAGLSAELRISPGDLAMLRNLIERHRFLLDEWLTVEEICEELKISRRTFDRWRAIGIGPKCEPLGGHGPLRSRRSWVEEWAESSERGVS